MKKALVIGGGFAGCAACHLLKEKDHTWKIDLVEKSDTLGAGNKTRFYGGHPYTFGPRHFLTPYEEVFTYLNKIIPMRKCSEHEFLTYVEKDNDFYAYPINLNDVKKILTAEYPKVGDFFSMRQVKTMLEGSDSLKGEAVFFVHVAPMNVVVDDQTIRVMLKELMDSGTRTRDAATQVAQALDLPRRRVYALAIEGFEDE